MAMTFCLGPSGFWLGEIIGLRRLKRESTRRFAFGDLRQRLASDYRSPLWLVAPLLLGIANLIIALISILNLPSPMRIALGPYNTVWLPTWLLLIVPTMMLLVVLGIEMHIRYIARFPRLLVITPPALAQRIDDMLRSIMIGIIIGLEYYLMIGLHTAQGQLLTLSLSGSASFTVSILLMLNPFVSMFFLIFSSIYLQTSQGHLGGSVSSWPRKGSKGEARGTAAADR